MQTLVKNETQQKATYDRETIDADTMTLSVSTATQKYANWEHYQNGAATFAEVTVLIAIRQWLCSERGVDPDSLTSATHVINAYNAAKKKNTEEILRQLKPAFRLSIGTKLREFAVRHHACGLTTAEVISIVLDAPEDNGLTPLRNFIHYLPQMRQACRDYLSTQLNYLKRGQPRFPQKYGELWETARAEHINEIQHLPLTHVAEQVAAMLQHYNKLLDAFNALPPDPEYTRERERLTNAMTKTMSGIYQMTRDPASPKPHTLQTSTISPKSIAENTTPKRS